jgi:hypothetical protein
MTNTNTALIVIISGEGTGEGTREIYTGARTARALNARLRKERCGGQRWARVEVDGERAWDADQTVASDVELLGVLEERYLDTDDGHHRAMVASVVSSTETDTVKHGYTFAAWLEASGRDDSASDYDLRAAWAAGEDPSDYSDCQLYRDGVVVSDPEPEHWPPRDEMGW